MEALTSCAPPRSNLCCGNRRNGNLSSSRALTRLLRYPKPNKANAGDSRFISLRFLNIKSSCYSLSSSSIVQADAVNVDSLTESTCRSKTVHVRFQLQKECRFGEQFLLVGDDPILGLWDPSNAIPLDWSDEHVWRVDLDLPIGKSIQYKFILKGATQELFWQPGPDRTLETWETKNTIVVSEDWENIEFQNITEVPNEESIPGAIDDDGFITAEEPMLNENSTSISTECLEEESLKSANDSFVAENTLGNNGILATQNVQHDNLVGYVGEPVLVPGLTPLPSSEEAISTKPESNVVSGVSTATDKAEESGMLEPCQQPKDNQQVMGEHDRAEYQAAPHDTLQNDFTWGRKTLHKLLTTLGLNLDQT